MGHCECVYNFHVQAGPGAKFRVHTYLDTPSAANGAAGLPTGCVAATNSFYVVNAGGVVRKYGLPAVGDGSMHGNFAALGVLNAEEVGGSSPPSDAERGVAWCAKHRVLLVSTVSGCIRVYTDVGQRFKSLRYAPRDGGMAVATALAVDNVRGDVFCGRADGRVLAVTPTSEVVFEGQQRPQAATGPIHSVRGLTLHDGILYSGSGDGWLRVWECR